MRFQTLRSRGGAGEGPSRDRGCCCLGDAGGGTGAFASAATAALPLRTPFPLPTGAVPGGGGKAYCAHITHSHHLTAGERTPWPAEPGRLLGLEVSGLPPTLHPPDLGQGLRLSFLLALVWPSHPERKASSSCLSAGSPWAVSVPRASLSFLGTVVPEPLRRAPLEKAFLGIREAMECGAPPGWGQAPHPRLPAGGRQQGIQHVISDWPLPLLNKM